MEHRGADQHPQAFQALPPAQQSQARTQSRDAYTNGSAFHSIPQAGYAAQASPYNSQPAQYAQSQPHEAGFAVPPYSTAPPPQYFDPSFLQQVAPPKPLYSRPSQPPVAAAEPLPPQPLQPAKSAQNSPRIFSKGLPHTVTKKDARRTSGASSVSKSPAIPHAPGHGDALSISFLLGVAEDLFSQANRAAHSVAQGMLSANVAAHHKMVATGLRLLETALQSRHLTPRLEARVRLRYASILIDETTNMMEAETALTEGISVCAKVGSMRRQEYGNGRKLTLRTAPLVGSCLLYAVLAHESSVSEEPEGGPQVDRHSYRKLYYVRLRFTPRPTATYSFRHHSFKHAHWVYAFRFLKASFYLQSGVANDHHALENLRKIASIAEERGDLAIYVMSHLLEGLAHLTTMKDDAVSRIHTCLAAAGKLQLQQSTQLPQIELMRTFLDFACSMHKKSYSVSLKKLSVLQEMMAKMDSSHWGSNDELLLPVKKQANASHTISDDTRDIIRQGQADDVLVIPVLRRQEYRAIVLVNNIGGVSCWVVC